MEEERILKIIFEEREEDLARLDKKDENFMQKELEGVYTIPCYCKIIHRDNFERKEVKKVEKNKKEKLVPVVVRISQENKNKIKELAERQGKQKSI